jgi:hypothetical protein
MLLLGHGMSSITPNACLSTLTGYYDLNRRLDLLNNFLEIYMSYQNKLSMQLRLG